MSSGRERSEGTMLTAGHRRFSSDMVIARQHDTPTYRRARQTTTRVVVPRASTAKGVFGADMGALRSLLGFSLGCGTAASAWALAHSDLVGGSSRIARDLGLVSRAVAEAAEQSEGRSRAPRDLRAALIENAPDREALSDLVAARVRLETGLARSCACL